MSETSAAQTATPHTKRPLGTFEITAIGIGFMGPVMAMSLNGIGVAGLVGKSVPFTFLVAFVGTLFVAYGFVRLTRKITHAGSVYALAGTTLGPKAGFFGGFALLGTYIFFAACIVGACAVFFEAMLAEMGVVLAPGMWMIVAAVVGVAALALNLRESAIVARTLLGIGFVGIGAMLILAIVIIVKIAAGDAPVSTGIDLSTLTPGDAPITAIMTAAVFGFLSWAGFESGTSLGEESDDPKRHVPRAVLLAVIIGGLVYVFMMFAQTIGFGTDQAGIDAFANASSTLTTLASTYIGPWFAVLISIIAFLVAFGALLSSSTAASRLLFALARDGFGPKAFARLNERTQVPSASVTVAVLLTTVMALVLGVFGATSVDAYYWYATMGTLCMVVAYGMTAVGVIRHMFTPNSGIKKWEVIFPLLALAFLIYVYVIQIVGQEPPYTYFPWLAGAWCIVGLIIVLSQPQLAKRIGARLTVED
ncbi:APC family permease [Gulosibacter faecalis]|jgi:amino acid transporter|uniref:APC family permease n=1 Tax=Gulosibacter faecalis TaxID=272240 RepID=A0ABW5V157_9MICO|nr:APC family permease [Gulosibacter faecalis]